MSGADTFAVRLRDEIHALLAPLIAAARQPAGVPLLLLAIGRATEVGNRADLRAEIARLAALAEELAGLDPAALDSWTGLAQMLDLARDLLMAVQGIERVVSDPGLADQSRDLGLDLVQHLLALRLRTGHPTILRAASLLTLITPTELAEPLPTELAGRAIVRFSRRADRFHPERINDLVDRPLGTLAAHYLPNDLAGARDAHEMARRLFPVLALLARSLGLAAWDDLLRATPAPVRPAPPEEIDFDHFGESDPPADGGATEFPPPEPEDLRAYYETFLPRFVVVLPGSVVDGAPAPAQLAIAALASSAAHTGGARGLVVTPLGRLDWSEVRGDWKLSVTSSGQVPALVLGPGGPRAVASNSPLAAATARLVAERTAADGTPATIVGAADGTRIEIGTLGLTADVRVAPDEAEIAVAADARSGVLVIAPGDGDSFISAVLPGGGVRLEFKLGLELSSTHGLRLRGGAGLDATLPVGLSAGGVSVPALHLSLRTSEAGIAAQVTASVGVALGPLRAAIEGLGIAAAVTFPESGGNLAIADLDLDFRFPDGVGLSVDAEAVTGGGFLGRDAATGQYAGVVHLDIQGGPRVKGIGLISTQLPNSVRGYSLLIIITAEELQPIDLGMGFRLTGIGGLLAINRTFNVDALRAGLKNGALDSVLFPSDPVASAPRIINTLSTVFPAASGHHLFGPMVQIAWGTPALITAELLVVLEIGARRRLLVLGQVTAILPRPEHDLIRLRMNTVGEIDFDQRRAALDATLHDSRLLNRFALTGDMALRLSWGASPSFALAVGGLHPAFTPPANFPRLERIAINLAAGDNPRLRCEAYVAVTSNTVQFGARAELYAAAAGFSIQGQTAFDVLIQLDPFAFLAEFAAQVQLKRGKTNLFKVRVAGSLAGPRPLRIKGKATFEIFWMDVSVRFDKTLVQGETPPAPEPVDVLPRLKQALADPASWTTALPGALRGIVSLREQPAATADVLLHPLGTLQVKQGVVPLNLDIARFGPTTPAGARRFTISSVTLADQAQTAQEVRDLFAPAQFFELSDAEQLSRPSFERLPAGVTIGSDEIAFGEDAHAWLDVPAITFETIVVDRRNNESRRDDPANPYQLSPALLARQARFGAAGRSAVRRTGAAKYRTARVAYGMAPEGWSIVETAGLSVQPVPGAEAGRRMSYSEAAQAVRTMQQDDPATTRGWTILRLSELQ